MHVHEVDVIYERNHSKNKDNEQKTKAFAVFFCKKADGNHAVFKNSISAILVSSIVY